MSIDQSNTVDFISTAPDSRVILTISDHHSWQEPGHFSFLQDKVNSYLQFIESGQVFEDYPNANEKALTIETVMKYEPTEEAVLFLEKVKEVIMGAGFEFHWRTLNSKE